MSGFMFSVLFIVFLIAPIFHFRAAPTVRLDPFGQNGIRVRIAPSGSPITNPPFQALLETPPFLEDAPHSVEGHTNLALQNGNLQITTDSVSGYITAVRVSDNKVLLKQIKLSFFAPAPGSRPGSAAALVSFQGSADEVIYGLGEHKNGRVAQLSPQNPSGYFKLFQDSQYYVKSGGGDISIPFYASSIGYAFVWNSPSYGYVELSSVVLSWFSNATQNVDFWISTTPANTAPDVSPYRYLLAQYADAVGHAPVMAPYTTGFIQSKNRYRSQQQILTVAETYRQANIPLSMIVIDYDHWVHFGDWKFNPVCWPDPAAMVKQLNSYGIEVMVTFWPMQLPESIYFNEFYNSSGWLMTNFNGQPQQIESWAGQMYAYDPLKPEVQEAVFNAFWLGYGQFGIKSVWLDGSEPERSGANNFGLFKLGPNQMYTDTEVGEVWTRRHAETFTQGFLTKGLTPSDTFLLPRSGWVGTWRTGAAVWSGDIGSNWNEFIRAVRIAQAFTFSGQVLWTTDMCGYGGGDISNPDFKEMCLRWFQFGAYCPLFRIHGQRVGGPPADECGETGGDNEVYKIFQNDQYTSVVKTINARVALRNYILAVNAEASKTGYPMVRFMALEFPNDPAFAPGKPDATSPEIEGQFMFGPDWLVSPVTKAGATTWSVYLPVLPANHSWLFAFNETSHAGGQTVTVDVSPATGWAFPLFMKNPPSLVTQEEFNKVLQVYISGSKFQ